MTTPTKIAFLQQIRRGLDVDAGAHAHVEHRKDRQRAGKQGIGEGAKELRHIGQEGSDKRTKQQRDDHHAAGYTFYRTLDRNLGHGLPPYSYDLIKTIIRMIVSLKKIRTFA
jgi:hypothetical protein